MRKTRGGERYTDCTHNSKEKKNKCAVSEKEENDFNVEDQNVQVVVSRPYSSTTIPFDDAFFGLEVYTQLTVDPTIGTYLQGTYLQQPIFMKRVQDIQRDLNNLYLHLKNQRVMHALRVLVNVKIQTHSPTYANISNFPFLSLSERKRVAKVKPTKQIELEPKSEPIELSKEESRFGVDEF